MTEVEKVILAISQNAKISSRTLSSASTAVKNDVLFKIAEFLDTQKAYILSENAKDLENGRAQNLSAAMLDRLTLSDKLISGMIKGLHEVIALPDPVGRVGDLRKRPNGLMVGQMSVPLGVIGMIYESRPNVTVDAAALCLKAGNSVILRGGSEAIYSNLALAQVIHDALTHSEISENVVQIIPVTDREAVNILLKQQDYIDLIIPRGGEGLIRFVAENSSIPVLKHYKGVCHIFVDKQADVAKALPIILNAKVQRPGVCNALEGLLIHEELAESFLPEVASALKRQGVELRGCSRASGVSADIRKAAESDWGTEFLGLILCVKVVSGYDEAKEYIDRYGSQHTESIITEDYSLAQRFIEEIDASAVMVNASTRFNDGGELGLGAEIGISTTKLHAYGPMGLNELTTKKFVVYGSGQTRN
jgi:glutamate-5-semialdehyde dehydrogenase